MKSVCIKFNNQKEMDIFIKKYNDSFIENSKLKLKKFKIFFNFIIHYNGDNEKKFLYKLSNILSTYIVENYEKKLLKKCINRNYFYFEEYEKEILLKISLKIIKLQETEFNYKTDIITEIIYDYLITNKAFYMEGFINFRLKEYLEILDYVVELSVMNYIKYV